MGNRNHIVASKRFRPRNHFVQHHPHTKKVRALVNVLPNNLLGRHVARRPEHLTIHRQIGLKSKPRNPKIGNFDSILSRQLYVVRLNIPMHHPRIMSIRQPTQHITSNLNRPIHRKKPVVINLLAKRNPVQELHRHKIATLVLAKAVHRHDVGMIQTPNCLGLTTESAHPVFCLLSRITRRHRKLLHRHPTIHQRIVGLVYNIVRPCNFTDDLILSQGGRLRTHLIKNSSE